MAAQLLCNLGSVHTHSIAEKPPWFYGKQWPLLEEMRKLLAHTYYYSYYYYLFFLRSMLNNSDRRFAITAEQQPSLLESIIYLHKLP